MKKNLCLGVGLLWALAAAGPASAVVYQFNGSVDGNFPTSGNWSVVNVITETATPGPGVPDDGSDLAIINASNTVSYATSAATTVGGLVVGADSPVRGDFGTPGTLNMSDGKITVTGGGDSFQIARACCAGDGALYMTNDAEIEIGGSDPAVGTRDNGILDIGDNAWVHSSAGVESYWRFGNYGPSIDAGLQGNGLLNVHGNGIFQAHVIFIGDNDSTGTIRVADNGQVLLTGNIVPRPSGTVFPQGSATVEMIGSSATFNAYNLESESPVGEIPNKYVFEGDAGGFSAIRLIDAVNITNNTLEVDLNGFDLPNLSSVVLFDAAPDRIFGTFSSVSIVGGNPDYQYRVAYLNAGVGDIVLQRVPEPSMLGLAGIGLALVACFKRRAGC